MPIGIFASLLICTVLYVLVSAVMVGSDAVSTAGRACADGACGGCCVRASYRLGLASIVGVLPLVKLGAIARLSSTILVQMVAKPRIFMSVAQDGLLPSWASMIHPRFGTPDVTTIVTGLIVSCASGITPIGVLGEAREHRDALRVCGRSRSA